MSGRNSGNTNIQGGPKLYTVTAIANSTSKNKHFFLTVWKGTHTFGCTICSSNYGTYFYTTLYIYMYFTLAVLDWYVYELLKLIKIWKYW